MTGCFQLISCWTVTNFYSTRNIKGACLFLLGNITLQYFYFESCKWLAHFIHHFPKSLWVASSSINDSLKSFVKLRVPHCGEEHTNEKHHCSVTFTDHKEPGLCTVLEQVPVAQLVKHGIKVMGLIQWMQKRWPSDAIKCLQHVYDKNPNKQVSQETHPLPDREGTLLVLEEKANTPLSVSSPATKATHTFSHFPT